MTRIDAESLLAVGPVHPVVEWFGLGGVDVAPRHHRGRAGPWSVSPGLRYPAGGTFLDRACAVEWDTEAPTGHLGYLAYAELKPSGQPRTTPDGEPLGGAWVGISTGYDAFGLGQPAMIEDNDRSKPPAQTDGFPWHLLAIVGIAGLIIAACISTDGGGFE